MNDKKEGIDLNELQREAEGLASLLQNKHPGLMTWNQALAEKIKSVRSLAGLGLLKSDIKSKKTEIDLDELQNEAQKLIGLLKDRHPGLSTWNGFMRERLESILSIS